MSLARVKRSSNRGLPVTLVVGDWLVDEYWFLVQHDSQTSAHSGKVHYRVANQVGEGTADLCGAGLIARILDNLRKSPGDYKICGVGDWHESDTKLLQHLLHRRPTERGALDIECDAVNAWYWYTPRLCKHPPDVQLITLHPKATTTRVIRQYHHETAGLEQLSRVDWEPDERPTNSPAHLSSLPARDTVNRIVIQDFKKGVITSELVRALAERYTNASWYIRSKEFKPPWLKEIAAKRLELMVVGPELATRDNPWNSLLVNHTPTEAVLDEAAVLPGKRVVFLSDNLEVVAVTKSNDDPCIAGSSYLSIPKVLQVRWISVFFGALIHHLSVHGNDTKNAIQNALGDADRHGVLNVPGAIELAAPPVRQPDVMEKAAFSKEKTLWQTSQNYACCGVVETELGEELHVWRAMPYLPGYIAIIQQKRKALKAIGSVLREFETGSMHRSVSILLQADPGSGKTFLARALADSFGFAFISADVSQMSRRDELFALFDDIATQQANTNTKVFVFIDEFNSLLDGTNVYGAFLSPLEEGVFLRRGKRFKLQPCAWLFAGTASEPSEGVGAEKLADLNSRLTMTQRIDYAFMEDEEERASGEPGAGLFQKEAALEQVYLAAAMIHASFPDVHAVGYDVLEFFRDLRPDKDDRKPGTRDLKAEQGAAPRRIRKYVEDMRNVQHGRITRGNCSWLPKETDGKDRMVRLVFN